MLNRWMFIIALLVLASCNKEELVSGAPSLVGDWIHYNTEAEKEIIYIDSEGNGKVVWYVGNSLERETKVKKWYVEDNRMQLGKVTFNLRPFNIDVFPTTSSNTTIEGYDTLYQGFRYIQLNDKYYREIQ